MKIQNLHVKVLYLQIYTAMYVTHENNEYTDEIEMDLKLTDNDGCNIQRYVFFGGDGGFHFLILRRIR